MTNLGSLTLSSLVSSTRKNEGKGFTLAKILAGTKDKEVKKKATAALALSSGKKGKKEKSMSLTTSLEKPVVKRVCGFGSDIGYNV